MKLSSLTIYIIGISCAMIALSFALFMHVMPEGQHAAAFDAATEKMNAEAGKQRQAEQRVAAAIKMVKEQGAKWRAIAAERTPSNSLATGGVNLNVNAFQLAVDTKKFRNSIQRAVNAQLKRGGVEVINGPYINGIDDNSNATGVLASFYNYPALGFPAVIFDLGTVTVRGTYDQIMSHVRAYKTMPHYLAVTDGLRLDGTSPNLTATYSLSIVGLLPATTINGLAPEGAGSSSTQGGPPMGGFGPAGKGFPGAGAGAGPMGPMGPGAGAPPAAASSGGSKASNAVG